MKKAILIFTTLCMAGFLSASFKVRGEASNKHLSKIRKIGIKNPEGFYEAARYYESLNSNAQKEVLHQMDEEERWHLSLGRQMIQKQRIIAEGWDKPLAFYQALEKAIRDQTPPDGKFHYF